MNLVFPELLKVLSLTIKRLILIRGSMQNVALWHS